MNTKKVIPHIVEWLKEYAEKARVKGYIVGVSGGVDSGVVSTLCAMTGLKTMVVEMPIRQKSDQVDRAQEHIAYLFVLFIKTNKYAYSFPRFISCCYKCDKPFDCHIRSVDRYYFFFEE